MKRDALRTLLERAGVRPSRSSGQNFLVEENLARAIARDGEVGPDDVVLEIGTGTGILTAQLAPLARQVVTVEQDARLLALARDVLAAHENVTFVPADALAGKNRLEPAVLEAVGAALDGRRLRIIANLPYGVATSLVVLLLSADLPLERMVVMVQLEAAERFAAGVGDPKYGAVSVLCRALCSEVSLLRRVPPDVFMPRPKVTSAVVRLTPRPERRAGLAELSAVARALFNYRRKTLARAAKEVAHRQPELAWLPDALARAGLDAARRPEQLELAAFRALAAEAPAAGPAGPGL